MSTTLEELEAQSKIVAVTGDIPLVAATLEALAEYDQVATSCATAMAVQGGMPDAVIAALSSANVAAAARAVITRGGGEDSRLEQQLLEAAITACERSGRLCGAHADHHDHCRIHAGVAGETVAACNALLAELS
jgi:molybdopterin-guanine dinucleotide biosynthesis protein A